MINLTIESGWYVAAAVVGLEVTELFHDPSFR